MIRIGKVSTVDVETGFVRVAFTDQSDKVSGPLPVLTPGGWGQSNELPNVGQNVLCIFMEGNLRDGFCLGSYWNKNASPPGDPKTQRGVWFEDGSHVFYDQASGSLHVKAAGSVRIDGDLIVSGTITRGGELV